MNGAKNSWEDLSRGGSRPALTEWMTFKHSIAILKHHI